MTLRNVGWLLSWALMSTVASAQETADEELLTFINAIRVVDNHTHALPALNPSAPAAAPADPLGTSPPSFSVRQRETNPEWIASWRALYGYRHRDVTAEHVRQAFSAKQKLMREKGADYPGWILDQAGVDIAFVNARALGLGQTNHRFRWVPYADGFLFPFPTAEFPGNPQPRRVEVGLDKAPPAWADYLASVSDRLKQWQGSGAVAVKFTVAYFRSLDFLPVAEADAKSTYERYLQVGGGKPRDYRTAEYKGLQDFLFRHVVREAGRLGLPVHIHTGEGGGPVFGVAGSNPLLVESVLNDFSITPQPTFVLVHGGSRLIEP